MIDHRLSFACMAMALVAASDASAQGELEEIVVTARRVEETIQDAPITVNAYTAEQIEDAGIIQTADFIQLTPNVTLAESQTMGTSFLTVRGLSRVRNGELPVAVVVDDVLIVNARQFIGQIFDVRQIEVVKGPQGALYGRNATNGAIIITTNPPTSEPEGYVKMSYGTADEIGVEASFSGPIADDLAFRLSGRVLERDGYFRNETLDDEVDPFNDRTIRGRLSWSPRSELLVDLKGQISKHEGKGIGFHWPGAANFEQFGFFVGTGAELGVTPEQVNAEGANLVNIPYVANNPDRGFRDTAGVSLKIDRDIGFADFKSVTTYDELETSSVADRAPYLSILDGTQHTYANVEGWSQEIRFESDIGDRMHAQAGAYYLSWERLRTTASGVDTGLGIKRPTTVPEFVTSTNPTGTAPGNFLSFLEDSNAWAVFASLDVDVTDALTLSLAARYDEETRVQNVNSYNTAGRVYSEPLNGVHQPYGGGACTGMATDVPNVNCGAYSTFDRLLAHTRPSRDQNEKMFSKFQPKITLGYATSENVNLYGSWGIGYRAGQYNYPGIGVISPLAKDVIDQEENSAFELGIKAQFGGLRLNAAWFDSSVENTQYFPFDGQAFVQVFEDIDEAELSGIEIEAVWRASNNLDFYAAYGTTDTEITAYDERPGTVGNVLPYVADGTFNVGAQARADAGNGLTYFARADYEMRGEQYWTPENTHPRDSLGLLNLRFGLEGPDWTASAYLNNATDEIYNSEIVTPLFIHPAAPRIWRLDYRYNF
ncbi:MAG: TonB-dependent receptor [Rhodospirillaceae bacterium]|nr:TonB-dependent receptor [Rhodospirillaceae bacterium]